ncbi:MAG TPA: hypothetical protein VGL62_06140, partial [Vicinamibacterales bacterium]
SGVAAVPGGRILYRSLESRVPSIWSMNADGSQRVQITTDGVSSWPAITPDGRSIIYSREGSGLWRVGIDGQRAGPIPGGAGGSFPQVTPDGRSIIFTGGAAGGDLDESLLSLPLDGGMPTSLLPPDVGGARAAVSPDGTQLAFYYHERGGSMFLAVMPIGGSQPTRKFEVAPSVAFAQVRWTPDGKALLHNSALADRANVWLQPLDGGPPRKVTRFSDQVIFAFEPTADGKNLIVARGTLSRDAVLIRNFR